MIASYIFSETTPGSPGTAPSSQPVQNSSSLAPAGVAMGELEAADAVDVVAELVGATGGVLDVYVQGTSAKDGSNNPVWFDLVHYSQLTAGNAAVIYRNVLALLPNATTTGVPVVVGKNNSPALTANTSVSTLGFHSMRLLFVAGASTTQGASIRVTVTAIRSHAKGLGA